MSQPDLHTLQLKKLFKGGQRFSYKSGEIIVRGDDEPSGVFFIEEGFVKVYTITRLGNENIRVILKAGELFPIIWAFGGSSKRTLFYEAFGNTSLLRVSRDDFMAFVKSSVSSSLVIAKSFMNLFTIYASRIDNLEYETVKDKVAFFLLICAKRYGIKEGKDIIISAPIKHQHIADSLTIARETASRAMAKFERKGLISYKTTTSHKGKRKSSSRHIVLHKFDDLVRHFEHFDRANPWN